MTTILKKTGILMMMTEMNSEPGIEISTHHLDTPLGEEKIKMLRAGDMLVSIRHNIWCQGCCT